MRVTRSTATAANALAPATAANANGAWPTKARPQRAAAAAAAESAAPTKAAAAKRRANSGAKANAAGDADADAEAALMVVPPRKKAKQALREQEQQPPVGGESDDEFELVFEEIEVEVTDDEAELVHCVTALSALADAKAAFKPSSTPGKLVGRENERAVIQEFLNKDPQRGGRSFYVSGVPGTGKSAMVDELMNEFLESQQTENQNTEYKLVKLNCMQFNDPQSIYKKLLSEFNVQEGDFGTNKNEPYRALERAFGFLEGGDNIRKNKTTKKQTRSSIVHILILDEIDQLATRDQTVLHRIFEWPTLPGSTLILVGIANALDLMQRYLPRLSGMKGGPQLLNFNPYTPAEISSIIKSRLLLLQQKTLEKFESGKPMTKPTKHCQLNDMEQKLTSFMHPTAVEICSRKAAGTGDLRRALDLVRMSFEVLEMELRRKNGCLASGPIGNRENHTPLASANLSNSPAVSTSFIDLHAHLTKLDEIPKVTIQHVLKAAGSVSGPGPVQKVKNLATQQKAVLVAVMDLVGVSSTNSPSATAAVWKPRTESSGVKMLKDPMVGNLHEAYVGLLKRKGGLIKPVTKTEFGDILSLFESVGLISLGKAKEERLRKVRLECLPAQVEEGIRDDPVLWGIWMDMTQDRGL